MVGCIRQGNQGESICVETWMMRGGWSWKELGEEKTACVAALRWGWNGAIYLGCLSFLTQYQLLLFVVTEGQRKGWGDRGQIMKVTVGPDDKVGVLLCCSRMSLEAVKKGSNLTWRQLSEAHPGWCVQDGETGGTGTRQEMVSVAQGRDAVLLGYSCSSRDTEKWIQDICFR